MASQAPQETHFEAGPGAACHEYRPLAKSRFPVMNSRFSRPMISGITTPCGQPFTQ